MISMEILGKIRRMYFRDKLSLHQIAKRTGLSRNTIRKWVRAPEATQPAYQRCATFNRPSPFHETLEQALKADSFRAKHNRRSAKALFEQIKAEGYDGGYSQLTAFIRSWRREQGKSLRAFVTLTFCTRRGLSIRLERRRSVDRRPDPTHPGLAYEALCQSRILVGCVSQPRPRDVVRCPYRQDWELSMSDLVSTMQAQNSSLGNHDLESLKTASAALADYRKAFEQFVESQQRTAHAKASMNTETQRVAELLARANDQQSLSISSDSQSAYRQLALITLFALVVGVTAGTLIRHLVLQPLTLAVELARRVASGDLGRSSDAMKRKDELGQLLETVGDMLGSLRGLVGRIGQGVGLLNVTASGLADVIRRNSQGVELQRQET